MEIVKERRAVWSSISVPVKEQPQFDERRTSLMQTLKTVGRRMSFSNLIRLVVCGAKIEVRDDGVYLIAKL
jgi:hypothetical protein